MRTTVHVRLLFAVIISAVFALAIDARAGDVKPAGNGFVATCMKIYAELEARRWSRALGVTPSNFFAQTSVGLRVDPAVRGQIQNLRSDLLIESASRDYFGHPVCLTSNHCHGASMHLRTILKDKLGMRAKLVTFEPGKVGVGGFEHSFLIIPDYFGPQSPLVIDPTIKQFMPSRKWDKMHDVFVGSPDEYLSFMREHGVNRGNESSEQTFRYFMQAQDTGRFSETP